MRIVKIPKMLYNVKQWQNTTRTKEVSLMRKKLQRIFLVSLAIMFAFSSLTVMAATPQDESRFLYCAEELSSLGLFKGTDNGYELDRAPSRTEAAVMLVRLLGKEEQALASSATHPFNDVPQWADRYIAYMYSEGLTNGISDTQFGAAGVCEAKMYITFVLRALGYDDAAGDFTYNNAISFARMTSVINSDDYFRISQNEFLRGDLASISFWALFAELNRDTKLLLEKLIDEKAVNVDKAKFYLDVIDAYFLLDYGYYKNYENGSIFYKETENIELSAAGYPAQIYKLLSEIEMTDIYSNSKEHVKYTFQYPGGEYNTYDIYYSDGYLYYDYGSDGKFKEAVNESITPPVADISYTTIFDDYKSVSISQSGGKTYIDSTLSDAYGTQIAEGMLSWFDGFNPSVDILIVSSAKEQAVINADGYLEKITHVVEFRYMIANDGVQYTVVYESVTEFSKLGETITIKFPDFSKFEEIK